MSSVNMYCDACQCGCLILGWDKLYKSDNRLKQIGIEKRPELINMVNSFFLIGTEEGVLGFECFDQLCAATKLAQDKLNEYQSTIIQSEATQHDEVRSYLYYLEDRWYRLVTNMHFINAYSAYAMYYYYVTGSASATSTKDGDVATRRTQSAQQDGSSENIEYKVSEKNAAIQLSLAKSFASIFKRAFLEPNKKLYCYVEEPCGCKKRECNECGLKAKPNRRKPKTVAL